jgi:hypothetical protein
MASGVLAEGQLYQISGFSNLWGKIQYRQKESSENGKVTIQARMYYKWNAGAASTYNGCTMQIYTGGYPGSSGSTLLMNKSYSWERTSAANECYTSWYDVFTWDNRSSVYLYAVVAAATSTTEFWDMSVSGIRSSYRLTTSSGTGYSISVNRQSSGVGGIGAVASNGILYSGDSIKISATPSSGYQVSSLKVNNTDFTNGNTYSVSGNVAVVATVQALASTVGATDANIGSTSTITVTKNNSTYYHSLQYSFGSLSGYITNAGETSTTEVKFSNTSVAFTLPTTFYAQIPSAKTGTCTITCRTYASASSTTLIGIAKTCTFTATASQAACSPTVSGTIIDENSTTISLTGNSNILVRYLSSAKCTISATARGGSSISKKSINGTSVSGTTRTISGDNLSSGSFTFSATDSRGYTTTSTYTKEMINYVKLTCNVYAFRPSPTTGEISITVSGKVYGGSWRSGVNNQVAINYRYKETGASNWEPITNGNANGWRRINITNYPMNVQNSTYASSSAIRLSDKDGSFYGFDYTKSYDFEFNYFDGDLSNAKYATDGYVTTRVNSGVPIFDWGKNDFRVNVPLKLGSAELTEQKMANFVYGVINYQSDDTALDKVQRAISSGVIPVYDSTQSNAVRRPFIGVIVSASTYFCSGFLYLTDGKKYGYINFSDYRHPHFFTVSADNWTEWNMTSS